MDLQSKIMKYVSENPMRVMGGKWIFLDEIGESGKYHDQVVNVKTLNAKAILKSIDPTEALISKIMADIGISVPVLDVFQHGTSLCMISELMEGDLVDLWLSKTIISFRRKYKSSSRFIVEDIS